MESFIYAILDKDGYCTGISQLSGGIDTPNYIRIKEDEQDKMGYKYDIKNKKWTNKKRPEPKYKIPANLEKEIIKSDIEYIKCLLEVIGGI